MIKGCFADNSDLPLDCNHDTGETWNCLHANAGGSRESCPDWQPQRAVELALDILGVAK